MRTAACSLLLLLAAPALGQEIADCATAPPITELVEPWEETTALLGEGAIRVALLEDEAGQGLLILTLPTIEEVEAAEGEAQPGALPSFPERRCRIVTEGGAGFALLAVTGIEVAEDPGAATLTARVPALRFVPESSELEEVTLVLTFGVGDDSLRAEVEEQGPGGAEVPDPEEPASDAEPETGAEPEEDAADAP